MRHTHLGVISIKVVFEAVMLDEIIKGMDRRGDRGAPRSGGQGDEWPGVSWSGGRHRLLCHVLLVEPKDED